LGAAAATNPSISGTITAPNATSTLSNQIANVGTLDYRYFGQIQKNHTPLQTINTLGGWVQIAAFTTSGYRTLGELICFIGTANNLHNNFRLVFSLDPYTESFSAGGPNLPVCLTARQMGAQNAFTAARMRMGPEVGGSVRYTYFDLLFNPSTSGIETYLHTSASVAMTDLAFNFVNLTAVVNPDTTDNVIGPNFMIGNGAIIKPDAGDFTSGREGQIVINTTTGQKSAKIYADGAWRTITTW
jgi:hypothetical protein